MMKDGSMMKDEEMMHKMPDGTMMRDMDMPALTGQGLKADSEELFQKHKSEEMALAAVLAQGKEDGKSAVKTAKTAKKEAPAVAKAKQIKSHKMEDGSMMLDQDMPSWEMEHAPGMHMMKDGSMMKDEEMMHKMPDGTMMRDMDMPALTGQGLKADSEELFQKHKSEEMALAAVLAQGKEDGKSAVKTAKTAKKEAPAVAKAKQIKSHKMEDGSMMLDQDIPSWEMEHAPG